METPPSPEQILKSKIKKISAEVCEGTEVNDSEDFQARVKVELPEGKNAFSDEEVRAAAQRVWDNFNKLLG